MNIWSVAEDMETAQFFTDEEKMHEYAIARAKELIDAQFDDKWTLADLMEYETEEEQLDNILCYSVIPLMAGMVIPDDGRIDPDWFDFAKVIYVYKCPWAQDILLEYAFKKLHSAI